MAIPVLFLWLTLFGSSSNSVPLTFLVILFDPLIMDVINMYRIMMEDEAVLRDAYEEFKTTQEGKEKLRHWHREFHTHHDRQGQGQYIAMVAMKACLKASVTQWSLSNQNTMHENMEGFVAWSLSQGNQLLKLAIRNVLNFMEEMGKMLNVLPWGDFEGEINGEWDIRRMQEKIVTIEDERQCRQ